MRNKAIWRNHSYHELIPSLQISIFFYRKTNLYTFFNFNRQIHNLRLDTSNRSTDKPGVMLRNIRHSMWFATTGRPQVKKNFCCLNLRYGSCTDGFTYSLHNLSLCTSPIPQTGLRSYTINCPNNPGHGKNWLHRPERHRESRWYRCASVDAVTANPNSDIYHHLLLHLMFRRISLIAYLHKL